jgi:hypothetical protein
VTAQEFNEFREELECALREIDRVIRRPMWRRRRVGEMTVSLTERRAMQAFHLLEGASFREIGRLFGRESDYVPRWVLEPRYVAFRVHVLTRT